MLPIFGVSSSVDPVRDRRGDRGWGTEGVTLTPPLVQRSAARGKARAALEHVALVLAAAWQIVGPASCAPQEGVVGVLYGAAGAGATSGDDASRAAASGSAVGPGGGQAGSMGTSGAARGSDVGFETQFADDEGLWTEDVILPGGSVDFGLENVGASDAKVAVLRFPGSADAEPHDDAGPDFVTQIQSKQRFGFGTFRTRVKFGTCGPGEEVASALLGYWGGSGDLNLNSLADEFEIDWQVLCGSPEWSYLTVFTDYDVDAQGNEVFRKVTRAIDFSSGDIYDTPSPSDDALVATQNDPGLMSAAFPEPDAFYELGFEWHSDRLRFFIVLDGAERTAWVLEDPARIPQQPLFFIYNLWHPETHWAPRDGAADFPAEDVLFTVDWLRITGEEP